MDKRWVLATAVAIVIIAAIIGIAIGMSSNTDTKDVDVQYHIDGNGGTHEDATKIDWKESNLPTSDYFTMKNHHGISFNTKSDGTGQSYDFSSSDAPKGSTLYVIWEYNFVTLKNELLGSNYVNEISVKCGSAVKSYTDIGIQTLNFGGKDAQDFDNHIDIIINDSASASIDNYDFKIVITFYYPNNHSFIFRISGGASMEMIDESGQNKGIRLTFSDSDPNTLIEMSTEMGH